MEVLDVITNCNLHEQLHPFGEPTGDSLGNLTIIAMAACKSQRLMHTAGGMISIYEISGVLNGCELIVTPVPVACRANQRHRSLW